MTKKRINKEIAPLGVQLVGKRCDGYFYFISLETEMQVGQSVMVCYLNQLTLKQWVAEARNAIEFSKNPFA